VGLFRRRVGRYVSARMRRQFEAGAAGVVGRAVAWAGGLAVLAGGQLVARGDTILDYPFHAVEGVTTINAGTLGAAANGAHVGGVTYSTDTPSGSGHSIRLDASGEGIQVPDAWDYGSALTVEAWIKPASIDAQSILWDDYGNPGVVLAVVPESGNPSRKVVQFSLSTASNPGGGLSVFAGDLVLDDWQHVAAVYDGSTMSIYVDGVLAGSTANSGAIQDNGGFSGGLGFENDAHVLPFDGWIDDFRIHDAALGSAQLAAGAFGEVPEPGTLVGGAAVVGLLAGGWLRRRCVHPVR
jgi:Concanavalin A-like lectin/glucanases superfamily